MDHLALKPGAVVLVPNPPEIVRVLRVVEYSGPRAAVEKQVANSIHGERRLPNGVVIKAASLGEFPEILTNLPLVDSFVPYGDDR